MNRYLSPLLLLMAWAPAASLLGQVHYPDEWWPIGTNAYPGNPASGNAWLRFQDGVPLVQPTDLKRLFLLHKMERMLGTWLLAMLLACAVQAQKHDYNWVTGYDFNYPDPSGNLRIDFNFNPPQVFKENLNMNFQPCRGSFSDSLGNLLFYTNGIRIFNRNHQLMEGGDTINPGPVWKSQQEYGHVATFPQFAIYQPYSHFCYLIHSDVFNGGSVSFSYTKHLYYSIVDTKANNGLGKVVKKNQVLLEGDIMWPAAVKHGNGRDWWIMGMKRADTQHYLYLLSPEGLSGPFVQDIGPSFVPTEYASESLFSEDGRYFLRHDGNAALRLYDFDRCSGQLSHLRIIPFQEPLHSFYAAFSPDSRFLYLSRPGWVWSLDLQAADLSASFDTVAAWEINVYPTFPWYTAYGLNQLGPDGKIYWSNFTSTQVLNMMHRPNLPGDAADCEEEAFYLPRWSDLGINQFPNYRLGEWLGSPCDTLGGEKPGSGFVATPYTRPHIMRRDTGYTLLSPIGGGRCDDCTERDLQMMNNPMSISHALLELRQTGHLPAEWPQEKAEREGMILQLPLRRRNVPAKDE